MEFSKIKEQLAETMLSQEELDRLQKERLFRICNHWRKHKSENARIILKYLKGNETNIPWSSLIENSRISNKNCIIKCDSNSIREISSSGSSGDRLNYSISLGWRIAHHAIWELAYQHMSKGAINNYLDESLFWVMARPFGGRLDSKHNQLECVPTSDGIDFKGKYKGIQVDVIHGSITTILEMLEDEYVQKWTPKYVVLTYEKAQQWQKEIIKKIWNHSIIHEEYASNDGGVSAFTCYEGNLHIWTNRTLFSINSKNNLVCIDLWNEATCFIGYNNGDEVENLSDKCNCGLPFPIIKVNGRASGNIILDNGKKIPSLGPFSPEAMKGILGVRIMIEKNNKARILYVPLDGSTVDFAAINSELTQFEFSAIEYTTKRSIAELREGVKKKFSIVVDNR